VSGGAFAGHGALPGGAGVSRPCGYDRPAADGLRGGTPHGHPACSEAYAGAGGLPDVCRA
jgi:hypothetical protein